MTSRSVQLPNIVFETLCGWNNSIVETFSLSFICVENFLFFPTRWLLYVLTLLIYTVWTIKDMKWLKLNEYNLFCFFFMVDKWGDKIEWKPIFECSLSERVGCVWFYLCNTLYLINSMYWFLNNYLQQRQINQQRQQQKSSWDPSNICQCLMTVILTSVLYSSNTFDYTLIIAI